MGRIQLPAMTKASITFGFILVFSLFTVGLSSGLLQNVQAQSYDSKHPDADTVCRAGQVLVYHLNFRKFICTSESGAAQWIRNGIAEVVGEPTPSGGKQLDKADFAKKSTEAQRKQEIADIYEKLANGERISKSEERMVKRATQFIESGAVAAEFYKSDSASIVPTQDPTQPTGSAKNYVTSSTMTSSDDPNNENEELAILLPLSDKTYIGRLSFSASEKVQYVTLIGPLGPGENVGQQTWSPDNGETYYALVQVDLGTKSGGWAFAGNALALHTFNSEPFTVTYSVSYVELAPGVYDRGTVGTGTIQSGPDPGIGHEGHSLAIILPPREIPYQGGFFAYSASENIQLVGLHGPLGPGDDQGQDTWSPDGDTKYALQLNELGTDGVWTTFSGNALAVHSMNPDGFTVSYAIGGLH